MKENNIQYKDERSFWLNKFEESFTKTSILYKVVNSVIIQRDKTCYFDMPEDLSTRILNLGKKSEPRILVILTSCLAVLLSELNMNKNQIVIGMPLYDVDDSDQTNTVIPFIIDMNKIDNVRNLLNEVKTVLKDSIENHSYPINLIPKLLNLENQGDDSFQIFDIALTLDNIQDKNRLKDFKYNLHFNFSIQQEKIQMSIDFNSSLYDETNIKEIGEIYNSLMSEMIKDLSLDLAAIEILSSRQKKTILNEYNSTFFEYDRELGLIERFIKQVEKSPDSIALVFLDQCITYRMLNDRSNLLAQLLIKKGVRIGDLIGLNCERSLDHIIGILGILKAGCGYLAIDSKIPKKRIEYMINDSGVKLVIGHSAIIKEYSKIIDIVDLEELENERGNNENINFSFDTNNIAYVIYTSGTTGNPKGVVTEQKNVIAYCQAFIKEFNFQSYDIILQQASYAFDTFTEELFPILFSGGKIVVANYEMVRDIPQLAQYILKNEISIIDCSPLLLSELGKILTLKSNIRTVISGGDTLKGEYLENFSKEICFYNTYGPTESTVCATFFNCDSKSKGVIPIGNPISNYHVYLLNKNQKLVPVGYNGEICIAGEGVARGYLNNVELTAEKFLLNPFNRGEMMYKSGDIGRLDSNGIISFCGRKDNQLSVRGYRIELGEIENQIIKHKDVSGVVVTLHEEDEEKWICAYVLTQKEFIEKELKKFLSLRLPEYMIPTFIIEMDELPKNINGKIDKKSLPSPFRSKRILTNFIDKSIIQEAIINLNNIPSNRKKNVNSLNIRKKEITQEEKFRLLFEFNNMHKEYDKQKHIIEYFDDQVKRTPNKIAVVCKDEYFTYHQLNRRVNIFSQKIVENGIKPNTIVGLLTQRSFNMIVGFLSILKAGGIFMPLEEEAPDARNFYIISNTSTKLVLVDEKYSSKDLGIDTINLSELVDPECDDDLEINVERQFYDLTHLLHTSGTTGLPKGVLINNSSIVNLLNYVGDLIKLEEKNIVYSLTPVTFDVFSAETLLPLIKGCTLNIANFEEIQDTKEVLKLINKFDTSFFQCSPTFLQKLLKVDEYAVFLKNVNHIISAGEPLLSHIKEKIDMIPNIELYNLYGPTETTLYSTGKNVSDKNKLNIGKPIYNTQIRILDNQKELVSVNEEGEIYIGGEGVARGYINQPELTHEAFNIIDDKRFYKTGDMAFWLPDGDIEFIGRIDKQVQIGGIRVELDEIESNILRIEGINEAAVIVKEEDEEKYLIGFIVSDKRIIEADVKNEILKRVPVYLVPRIFVQLEIMPYTASRKINRRLLESLDVYSGNEQALEFPVTDKEKYIAEIWSEVLNIPKEKIGVTSNFFTIGGNSLKATAFMNMLKNKYNLSIPLIEILKNPTIIQLAELINETQFKQSIDDENLVLINEGDFNSQNVFLIHDGSGDIDGYMEFCKLFQKENSLWGIKAGDLKKTEPVNINIEELSKKYIDCIKKVQNNGEYSIVGWSLGGTIAFEIVRQLEQENKKVKFLGIVDSIAPKLKSKGGSQKFSMKSEISWLKNYFDDELISELNEEINLDGLWRKIIIRLKDIEGMTEVIKDELVKNIGFEIKEYIDISIEELIRYMNFSRSLTNACQNYFPKTEVKSEITFFEATKSKGVMSEDWRMFTTGKVNVQLINGDHFSIFRKPYVEDFYKQFISCFYNVVDEVLYEI